VPSNPEPTIGVINESFAVRYPGEAARVLEQLPVEDALDLLRNLKPAQAGAVFQRLLPDPAVELLGQMDREQVDRVLSTVDPARTAAVLARFDDEDRERYLEALDATLAAEIRALIDYPFDSAGRLMDARVTGFRPEETAQNALRRLRRFRDRRIQYLCLVDEENRLTGAVPLEDLALAPPRERLGVLARAAPARVQATASRAEVLEELEMRRVTSLPVVDFDNHLVGMIRQSALVSVAQEEASVDIQTMVGASKEERALSPPLFAVRKRLPWLQINLATAFLAAAVVGLFEETIARFTALAVLLPVVAGQSGNTGAQALAVTMRGLALREIRTRHWLRVSTKEVMAAAINGVAVAATTALGVYLWSGSAGLTLVIGISMVASMTLAGLSGAAIPILLSALGQDPAQSSSIILTTVTDVVGFFSFLGIATVLSFML
jgi:magnesium transporter